MAHTYYKTLAVAFLIASFASQSLAGFMGGASTFAPAGGAIIKAWNAAKPGISQDVVAYDSVGSGAGITGFNGGTYLIAVSDDPMTAAQEGGVVASGKITVPLCVSTFSFFVNGKPGIVLTATQTFQIYSGAISAWSAVPGAVGKVAGTITPVGRSDKSGSTAIVKTMWSKAVSGYSGGTDGTAMAYAGVTKVEGTSAVCAAVLKTRGAIGYAFTGGCSVVPFNARKPNNPKRVIAALKNAAGVAVAPPSWVPGAALVGAPPAADGSWSNVDFIWKGGAKTPAMVSMEYGFIRKSLTGVTGGKIAKAFMQFMIGKLAKGGYGFNAVPAGWRNPSIAMVNAIAA
ncbi:unnamed protein product [Closterium sp. Naga37s-1]|nr:unnamed protein product [Closterium sp. Naga37s-1]